MKNIQKPIPCHSNGQSALQVSEAGSRICKIQNLLYIVNVFLSIFKILNF